MANIRKEKEPITRTLQLTAIQKDRERETKKEEKKGMGRGRDGES